MNADCYVSTGQGLTSYNMFAYCLDNPIFRKDISGTNSEALFDDYDPTDDDKDIAGGNMSNGSLGGFWNAFCGSLKDGLNGLQMASGKRNTNHEENHHLISNKRRLPVDCREIIDRYNYSLNHDSNIVRLKGHRGRHTNVYHTFIYSTIRDLDSIANGCQDIFIEGMKKLGEFIKEYSWLPYARKK